jgi:hypothetical protein
MVWFDLANGLVLSLFHFGETVTRLFMDNSRFCNVLLFRSSILTQYANWKSSFATENRLFDIWQFNSFLVNTFIYKYSLFMFTFFVLYFAVSQTGSTHEMFRNKDLDMSMLRPKLTE